MTLRIVFLRAQLGMMIQMPSGELARRNSAWNGVEQPKHSFRDRTPPFEDRVMYDLMQKDREIEDGEPLHERERHPDQRILEPNQSPGGKPQNGKLPGCDEEVPPRSLAVEFPHLLARDGLAQLSSERNGVLGVVMGFHRFFNFSRDPVAGIRDPSFIPGLGLSASLGSGPPQQAPPQPREFSERPTARGGRP
jgi:hypothetical protein